jgi:hypothetical protein
MLSTHPYEDRIRSGKGDAMTEKERIESGMGRRELLFTLAAAAASGLAAGKTSLAAGSLTDTPGGLPTVPLGRHRITRLIAGSNPILGYSYQGPHTDRQMREYFTPERTIAFLKDCEKAGITTHQFGYADKSVEYLKLVPAGESRMQLICLHSDREKLDEAIRLTRPIAVAHHGGVTDRLFAEGKAQVVQDYVKAVHDKGLLAGVSAHNPDCIRRVADAGWEVDFFMACFYFLTRKTAGQEEPAPTLEISYPFYKNDPQVMTGVIRQVDQPCLAFKVLGAGRLCSSPETVRAALQYAFENIKPGDAVIVGMFPQYFDEIGANVEHTRELCRRVRSHTSRGPADRRTPGG